MIQVQVEAFSVLKEVEFTQIYERIRRGVRFSVSACDVHVEGHFFSTMICDHHSGSRQPQLYFLVGRSH